MVGPLNVRVKNESKKKIRELTSGRSILHFVHLVWQAGVTLGGGDLRALAFPFAPPFLVAQNMELTVPRSLSADWDVCPSPSTKPGRTVMQ